MLSRTVLRLATLRALAIRLYADEQMVKNPALKMMPADQRQTIIEAMFKGLTEAEVGRLQARAAAAPLAVEPVAGAPAAAAAEPAAAPAKKKKKRASGGAAKSKKAAAPFVELTPYEFFVREQSNNPAVRAVVNAQEREAKLAEIYSTLPEAARELLEQRATAYNHTKRYGTPAPKKAAAPARKPKKVKNQKLLSKRELRHLAIEARRAMQRAAKKAKLDAKSKRKAEREAQRQERLRRKKRAAPPYAQFVKAQMAELPGMPIKERMREAARRWRALSETDRAAWLAKGVTAQRSDDAAKDEAPAAATVPIADRHAGEEPTASPAASMASSPETVVGHTASPVDDHGASTKANAAETAHAVREEAATPAVPVANAESTEEPPASAPEPTAASSPEKAAGGSEVASAAATPAAVMGRGEASCAPPAGPAAATPPAATPFTQAPAPAETAPTTSAPAAAAGASSSSSTPATTATPSTERKKKVIVMKRMVKKKKSGSSATPAAASVDKAAMSSPSTSSSPAS